MGSIFRPHVTLPLPVSKNQRVRIGHRTTWKVAGGRAYEVTKPILRSSKEWNEYLGNVYLLFTEQQIRIPHPRENERIVLECLWFLRSDRQDVSNFHDLLCDAVKKVIEVDDRWFLVRDLWSEVDEANPRLELTLYVQKRPTSCSR